MKLTSSLRQGKNRFTLLSVVAIALLMTQFNNCGSSPQATVDASSSASIDCTTATCVTPDSTLLHLTPHLNIKGDYGVAANLSEFSLGGDCNEGGYPYNTIRWELYLSSDSNLKRSSAMPLQNGLAADTHCVNGHFSVYVNLAAVTGVDSNCSRTGLSNCGAARSSYDLWISIYGQAQSGAVLDTSLRYKTLVPLTTL